MSGLGISGSDLPGSIPEGARCAEHPESTAVAICERCGSFACGGCVDVVPGGDTYCARCAPVHTTLASRDRRLVAYVLDGFIAWLPGLLVFLAITMAAPSATFDTFGYGAVALNLLVVFGINLHLLSRYGQSIAKRWLGIMITRTDGSRADLGRLVVLRQMLPVVIRIIPILGSVFGLADALFIFREDRRCIHDFLADTRVIEAPDGFDWTTRY